MPLVLADRVKDTTTTTGTGTITLSGTAPIGYVSFGTAIGNGNTTYYTITAGSEWEVGIGTYTASGTTLSRDTVLASSAGGTTKVTFSAGTKDVFVTYPAGKAISDGFGTLPAANGGTGLTSPGTSANVLTSNGTAWVSGAATVAYPQNAQNGNYTLVLGDAGKHIYSANTGAQTITIPTNASVAFPIGTLVTIVNRGTTQIVLGVSGVSVIANGSASAIPYPTIPINSSAQLIKTGTNTWEGTFGTVAALSFSYLSIAGGGSGAGGAAGGGGGAGGYITGTSGIATGTLTVTVGAGGAATTTTGNNGSNSSLTGTTTAVGGGAGGYGAANGASGGSGGGGGAGYSGTITFGGAATSGQGYAGGGTPQGTTYYQSGGGGGAGAVGADASTTIMGSGGNGLASSITGTSVTRAGGGGGGGIYGTNGAGGAGGGGAGANPGGSGTANTGSGGGGANNGGNTSGAGGSGVVIISSPIAATSTTGSPSVTSSGGNTIYTFNSSGSLTF
jgi:hypothetical protein